MEIRYREFVRHAGRYIREGGEIELSNGIRIAVSDSNKCEGVSDKPEVSDKANVVTKDIRLMGKFKEEYGCGCLVVEGEKLCSKHGRS